MTAQATAGVLAGLLIALALAASVYVAHLRRQRDSALELAGDRQASLGRERDALERVTRTLEDVDAHRTALEAELVKANAELAEHRRSPLEGELVIVNTPRPDDQSIKGVCVRDLGRAGGMVLEAAVYLDRGIEHGREVPREVPAGDVVVDRYSWAQIVRRTEPVTTQED